MTMIRIFSVAFLSYVGLVLIGCEGTRESEPIWQQIKITDIGPANSKQLNIQLLKGVNFNIYIFEMPAENIDVLDDVWELLYTEPLRFNNYDAFVANSFLAGFGQVQMWNKIADLLRGGECRKVETISLLLADARLPDGQGQANDVIVGGLVNEQTIFYMSAEGTMEGVTIGPGELGLRIKAEKIRGQRGVCKVDILPVFLSLPAGIIPQLDTDATSGDFVFASAGFGLKMSPGDFVFLGPKEYHDHQITLDSLFFSRPLPAPASHKQGPATSRGRPGRKPTIRTYLIVCTSIMN